MIKCKICESSFSQLTGHLIKHNITPEEYKRIYNVDTLYSEEALKKVSNKTKESMNNKETKAKLKKAWESENRKKEMSLKMHNIHLGKSPTNKLSNEEVQERLDKIFPNKFKVLVYKNQYSVEVLCKDCERKFITNLNNLKTRGCSYCNKMLRSPRENTWNKISSEEFENNFKELVKSEYTLLSPYIGSENKIHIRHNLCGYSWKVTASSFYSNGSRCPYCAKKRSHYEEEIVNYIKSFYKGEIYISVRDVIFPKELDIYIPEKKVAIEFNGTYRHSSAQKSKTYHYEKSNLCEKGGIRLIHIFEYEWTNERQHPILLNIIKNSLGYSEEKIYARKCDIVIKESREMRSFFETNNIQGFRGGKFSICLVYNNEIVMAYQMGSCFFGKGKYEWEVIRGATKLGANVIGGASKIWKYFLDTYNPNTCVYYVDYNYFNGNSLPYLGLKYLKSQISFKNYWILEKKVKNREPSRNKEIKQLQEKGLVIPIYNAGTKVYLYKKNSNL